MMPLRTTLLAGALLSLLCGAAGAQQATSLGRLFTDPAERAALDTLRANGGQPAMAPAPVAADVAPAPVPYVAPPPAEPLVMNGFVRRSDGKNTVWLNQQPQNDGGNTALPERARNMKPGQRFNPDDGSVKDAYER